MTDYSPYYNQMAQIDQEMMDYNTAKAALTSAQTEYQTSQDQFKKSDSKFDSDVPNIKESDRFEGDLANALEKKVSELKSFMDTAAGDADNVLSQISAVIAGIDGKVAELVNRKIEVNNQLINAINAVNAANAADSQ
jgi:chromosome segregation ATPase